LLHDYFDLILAAAEGQACKPSALVFEQRVLPIFPDLTPSQCIMVGDTATDLQFAKNIGANACFASYGYGNVADCEAVGYSHQLSTKLWEVHSSRSRYPYH
jgi:phosphoglycolate phosphatase